MFIINYSRKIHVIIICGIGFLIINPLSMAYISYDTNSIYLQTESLQLSNQQVEILNVKGGMNLEITFINTGNSEIRNLNIIVEIIDGIILSPRTREYEIPLLTPDEPSNTYTIQNQILGLGITKLIRPHINIFTNISGNKLLIGQLDVILLGIFNIIVDSRLNTENSYQGYTLFTPEASKNSYLIDNAGTVIHQWNGIHLQGLATYLLPDGNLIRCESADVIYPTMLIGGFTGYVAIYNKYSNLVWDFTYSTNEYILHHDIEVLPNGNILMIAAELKSKNFCLQEGCDPDKLILGRLLPDYVIEVKPNSGSGGEIVWEWHLWDHLIQDFDPSKNNYGVVGDHPELIDVNYRSMDNSFIDDFTHINSIDYHEEADQILLSVPGFNEVWVIDHSTTTAEAAGHTGGRYGKGGDLLYRWGNPQTYRAGTEDDQQLFSQHDANWIEEGLPGEGNILIFNNKNPLVNDENPNQRIYSSVVELSPPVDSSYQYVKIGSSFGPNKPLWTYYDDENPYDFCSYHLSSAQRLPNGNTLICEGAKGKFTEVTAYKEIVWTYTNPYGIGAKDVFKVLRYGPDDQGIQNLFR